MTTYREIIQQLKQKKYAPIYFLYGEESYYIDVVSEYIENNVLDEMAREFDQTIIYAKDLPPANSPDVAPVIAAARRYPMMGEKQVVIVKEAQSIKKWEALGLYLEKPMSSTILVFCYRYGKPDMRRKEFKDIEKTGGVMMESQKLRDNQVEPWIRDYVSEYSRTHNKKLTLVHPASTIIAEYLGADLQKIASEIDKLMLAVPPDTVEITPAIVERCMNISKDFNVFELEKALVANDALKAYLIKYANPTIISEIALFVRCNTLLCTCFIPLDKNIMPNAEIAIINGSHFANQTAIIAVNPILLAALSLTL